MKKTLLTKKLIFLLSLIFSLWQIGSGQAVFVEEFDYPNSSLLTANGWTAHSGSGTNAIDVIVPGLSFPGYPSVLGGAAQVDNTGEDVNKSFASQTSGSVYVAFLINVSSSTVAGDYFFHVIESPTSSYFKGRVWIKQGSSASKFLIGVAKTGTTPAVAYSSDEFDVGTTYLIILKYQFNSGTTSDDIVTLYVNPTPLASEPAQPTVTASDNTTTDGASVTCVALRQGGSSSYPKVTVDAIRVATNWTDAISDVTPPVPTFEPSNGTTDVPITVAPTITYDEPVRKPDGSALENSDLVNLVTLKKTDASGADVPFSATIDASKKVITVTPSSPLDNSQLFYLAVGAVEDVSANESTGSGVTFTTIGAAVPTITLTYPAGGETMYAGDEKTLTWTSANVTNVLLEVYSPDDVVGGVRVWSWNTFVPSAPAAPGSVTITVPADAPYGTEYKIRISDLDNPTVVSTSGDFTIIADVSSLTDLKEKCLLNEIVRISSEVTVTFLRSSANRNQKYVQDAGAGLMIDDASSVLTTPLAVGDNIRNLEGKLGYYNGMNQIVPTKATVTVASSNNIPTVQTVTIAEYTADFDPYEARLIKLVNVNFPIADGSATFGSEKTYDLTDAVNTVKFFTFEAPESNIVGTVIPMGNYDVTGLAMRFNTTVEIASRTLSDLSLTTGIENASQGDKIKLYPVPATSVLNLSNVTGMRGVEILDIAGKVIRTITTGSDEVVSIPVSELSRGTYILKIHTAEGTVVRRFVKQ